ncbi:ankyrin repeat domain-containing protein [Microbulbifer sp. PAAF003]|uniref:ankyrin repeat domain-containing protein n=1 Tax=Microbulbifer sp. PAAF003 TaxID=3243375 RepID=UPI004039A9E8
MKKILTVSFISLLLISCGKSELHEASKQNDVERISALIQDGADTSVEHMSWGTPLHTASEHGNIEAINILLDAGVDINKKSGVHGYTPLHRTMGRWNLDATKVLLIRGADHKIEDDKGRTVEDLIRQYGPAELGDKKTSEILRTYKNLVVQHGGA